MIKHKRFLIILIIVILAVSVPYLLVLSSCKKSDYSENISDYEAFVNQVNYAKDHMPSLSEFNEIDHFSITRNTKQYLFWKVESVSLELRFTQKAYQENLKMIENKYHFLTEVKKGLNDYEAQIDGYYIRIVDIGNQGHENNSYHFPKCFMMIGVNVETNSVIYLFHNDPDLDEIKDLDKYIQQVYHIEKS